MSATMTRAAGAGAVVGAGSVVGTGAVRRPGRPRRADIEQRVLDTVIALIDAERDITVNAVVEGSGVSRAAVYRRWPTLAKLVAAALDRGRAAVEVPEDLPLREIFTYGYPQSADDALQGYPESRLRQRVRLGLGDRALQRETWESHVSRRREPMRRALLRGRERGELRPDADIEAALDLVAGVYYYQFVVRGDSLDDPATLARCSAAVDTIWRGIRAE
ncbi:TetR/AcrR family transcriptional regulator [Microbacterium sp. C7(2022)]|uniref:TetR/AcrR family transcriptional regulator n=1 Tax=Microbacterium sp. C7(2022) TaxID=2992759 RepID=UPI00237A662B|nr:TetR/AcrR family transcriptional regulator [Microbacterium sp. C7(2022)]MDE0546658.1 TetR/AcrR family transcriptional regulator [Microbacterium sp. C7(2022)]